jgi:PadR family transcriptional regulator, regulatory protein PadR
MDHQTFDSQGTGRRVNEILLLAELEREPMHGYQIALNIEERSGGYFPFSHGTMYPILHRLEKEGLIAGDWSDPAEGRPRKEYALTEAGRAYLAQLIEDWRRLRARLDSFLTLEGETDGQVHAGAA